MVVYPRRGIIITVGNYINDNLVDSLVDDSVILHTCVILGALEMGDRAFYFI